MLVASYPLSGASQAHFGTSCSRTRGDEPSQSVNLVGYGIGASTQDSFRVWRTVTPMALVIARPHGRKNGSGRSSSAMRCRLPCRHSAMQESPPSPYPSRCNVSPSMHAVIARSISGQARDSLRRGCGTSKLPLLRLLPVLCWHDHDQCLVPSGRPNHAARYQPNRLVVWMCFRTHGFQTRSCKLKVQ